MSKLLFFALLLVLSLWIVDSGLAEDEAPEPNRIVNGDFEKDLSGWTTEGEVTVVTTAPMAGKSSLRIGPGKGAIRQRYTIRGLQVVYFGATVKTDVAGAGVLVRAQCYDAKKQLVMDLQQPLDSKQEDGKDHKIGLYFKTQAHTATMVVSIEKTNAHAGPLYADTAVLTDFDRETKTHRPAVDLNQYMVPFWQSKTVYNETVLLLSQKGLPASGSLLFTPKRILSVRDYSLGTTYAQGKDYTLNGKTLTITTDSRMPSLKDTDFPKGDYPWLNLLGKHVVVTYTHEDSWTGILPTYQGDRLPRTMQKLTSHSPLTIAALGDSITHGNGTSAFTHIAPYMPTWGELVARRLTTRYANKNIHLYNAALGGMTADWGRENAESAVASLQPDLVIIAFGMNDFWSYSGDDFLKNTQGIMDRIRAKCPNVEFLLVSTMRFDPSYTTDATYISHILDYAKALNTLAGNGVAFLDMTSLTGSLYAAKNPKDYLADPMHPNDYLARWYAQSIVALLDKSSSPSP